MALGGRDLLSEREDLTSHPQHPREKLNVVVHVCNPSTGETETGGLWGLTGL